MCQTQHHNPLRRGPLAPFPLPSIPLTYPFQVYDRLYYVPFTRMATLSPEIAARTLTVGSGGKNFYCTGWRVGWLIGPEHLVKHVSAAHTRICFSSVSPLQEAVAVGFEQADAHGFWEASKAEMKGKMDRFNEVWDELGLPVRFGFGDSTPLQALSLPFSDTASSLFSLAVVFARLLAPSRMLG